MSARLRNVGQRGRAVWSAAWFAPETALNLAAARVVFALHAIWILLSRELPAMSGLPQEFYAGVSEAERWRYLLFEGHAQAEWIVQYALLAALVAAALGVLPRTACLVSGLLLYHLAPLESLLWTAAPYERGLTISTLALVTLSAAPCGDALTLFRRRAVARAPGEYGWALRLVQLFLAQIYLFAGWTKLQAAGLDWLAADNLRAWLLVFTQQDQVAVFTGIGRWIADRPALCLATGVFGLGIDFAFVLAVFSRSARKLLIPLALFFHAGILFTMNIAFLNLPQLLVFVNWSALKRRSQE